MDLAGARGPRHCRPLRHRCGRSAKHRKTARTRWQRIGEGGDSSQSFDALACSFQYEGTANVATESEQVALIIPFGVKNGRNPTPTKAIVALRSTLIDS